MNVFFFTQIHERIYKYHLLLFPQRLWSYLETILLVLYMKKICLSWSSGEREGKIGEQPSSFSSTTQIQGCYLLCTDVAARRPDIPEVDCIVQYGPLNDPKNEQNGQGPEWKRVSSQSSSSQNWLQLQPQFTQLCGWVSDNTYIIKVVDDDPHSRK